VRSADGSRCSCVRKDDGDNESVKTEGFAENEDEDHTDEDIFLSSCADTSITGDADRESGGQRGQTAAQAGGEVFVTRVRSVLEIGIVWSRGDVGNSSLRN
jgi:hypothetical protein